MIYLDFDVNDFSDFFGWADEEIEKERQPNGELTKMGCGILRIRTLILNRLEQKHNDDRVPPGHGRKDKTW